MRRLKNPRPRCSYCGSARDIQLYGNDPASFRVRRGFWPAGHYLCARCVRAENGRALVSMLRRIDGRPPLRTPRLAASILKFLRTWGRRP